MLSFRTVELGFEDYVIDGVTTLLGNVGNCPHSAGREHNLVFVDQRVFVDVTVDVTARNVVADLSIHV